MSRVDLHTITLIQKTEFLDSRTFTDHESPAAAINNLVVVFEEYWRNKNQGKRGLTFESKNILEFLDSLHDLSFLIYDKRIKAYAPRDRTWVKNALHQQLIRDARRN